MTGCEKKNRNDNIAYKFCKNILKTKMIILYFGMCRKIKI